MSYSYERTIILTLIFVTLFSTSLRVNAGGGVGGATEVTQIANHVELVPTAIATGQTAISTDGLWVREYILNPAANVIIQSLMQTVSERLITWVNNGFSGQDPLLISDPQKYITKVGLDTAHIQLANLPEDNYFSGSIFSAIKETASWEYLPIKDKLESLTKSNTAELIQANSCGESTISSLASESGVDASELYAYLCEGDPSDPEVKARLEDYAEQNPEATGWGGWLSLTGGENDYTRQVESMNEATNDQVDEQTHGIYDLYQGQNPLSERECIKWGEDINGNALCEETDLTTPSDTVNETLNKSATAGLERLFNIQGADSFTSFLANFATQALIGGIRKGVSSLTNSSGGSGGGGSTPNTTTTTGATSPFTQDLDGNPEAKSAMTTNLDKGISHYEVLLDELQETDTNYSSLLTGYEGKVNSVKSCYDGLVSSGKITYGDSSYQSMLSFYNNRTTRIRDSRNTIAQDTTKTTTARGIVAETKAEIADSNSTEEISQLFMNFQSKITEDNVPSPQTIAARKGEFILANQNIQRDTEPESLISTCNTIKSQVDASPGDNGAL